MPRMDCAQFAEALHELDRPGTPGAAFAKVRWPTRNCAALAARWSPKPSRSILLLADLDKNRPNCKLRPNGSRAASGTSSGKIRGSVTPAAGANGGVGIAAAVLLALGFTLRRPQIVTLVKTPSVIGSVAAPIAEAVAAQTQASTALGESSR